MTDRCLRLFAMVDETPFYQPEYLERLITESSVAEVVGAARVAPPGGGPLQPYLLRDWRLLGVRELMFLGMKSMFLRTLGHLPPFIRGQHEGSVAAVLSKHRIPYQTINCSKSASFHAFVRERDPDVILSSSSLIFPTELTQIAKVAAISRHSDLVPSYGGILPILEAIRSGESFAGVSIHIMTGKIEAGSVLSRRYLPIEPGDSLDHLHKLSFVLSFEATEEALIRLRDSDLTSPDPEDALARSYFISGYPFFGRLKTVPSHE